MDIIPVLNDLTTRKVIDGYGLQHTDEDRKGQNMKGGATFDGVTIPIVIEDGVVSMNGDVVRTVSDVEDVIAEFFTE